MLPTAELGDGVAVKHTAQDVVGIPSYAVKPSFRNEENGARLSFHREGPWVNNSVISVFRCIAKAVNLSSL